MEYKNRIPVCSTLSFGFSRANFESFGAMGTISCVIAYFILPEITCRTPAEIDEMFEDKIAPRKFRNHVTQVQLFLEEKGNQEQVLTERRE